MAEYIERETLENELYRRLKFLIAEYGEYDQYTSGFDDAMDMVRSFTSADVAPMVRCRECKHLMFSDCYGECGKGHMGIVNPDDFCSYGKRREEQDDELIL